MSDSGLEFQFSGKKAADGVTDLALFLEEELPDWERAVREQTERKVVTRGDAAIVLATLTLVLTIPQAVQASWDLAQRMKLKEKVERLIAWARERRERGEPNPDIIFPLDARPLPLDQATPQQILDAIAAEAKGKGEGES